MASSKFFQRFLRRTIPSDAPQHTVAMPLALVSTSMAKPHFVEHLRPGLCSFCEQSELVPTEQQITHDGQTLQVWRCPTCAQSEGRPLPH